MKRVQFSEKITVHEIGSDKFIQSCLSSAADCHRFQLRIQRIGLVLDEVLP